jgi:UDP-N-acetylglucosamine 2-epimerase (non-hydrolysing)
MAPVAHALNARPDVAVRTLVTAQHREALDAMMQRFGLSSDVDLDVMTPRQTLPDLVGRMLPGLAAAYTTLKADLVLVHGDTATTFAAALAAFYAGIPVGHVEAGLRSFDLSQPFPEEANRKMTDTLATLHFAPTERAAGHLRSEGASDDSVFVTGNTAVDALRMVDTESVHLGAHADVLVTLHRRENLAAMGELAAAVARVASRHENLQFTWPVHPNPAVRDAVQGRLEHISNVKLTDPLPYDAMIASIRAARLVLTDSGGLQEEGPALGTRVAVVRAVTERPEGVDAGVCHVLGVEPDAVERGLDALLKQETPWPTWPHGQTPYGDGRAAQRIAQAVAFHFGLAQRPENWSFADDAAGRSK